MKLSGKEPETECRRVKIGMEEMTSEMELRERITRLKAGKLRNKKEEKGLKLVRETRSKGISRNPDRASFF